MQALSSLTKLCFEITRTRAIVMGLVLLYFTTRVSKTAVDRMMQFNINAVSVSDQTAIERSLQHLNPALRDFLESIKNATGSVTAPKVPFTSADRLQWEARNPCKARTELKLRYERRKHVKNVDTPPALMVLMCEYEKLHRTCVQVSGNLSHLFLSKNASSTGCQFLVAEAGNGLGNRILWMVSALVYALLTKRVILIDSRSMIPSLMCEPFPGSSWVAPADFPFADLRPDLWQSSNEFLAAVDAAKKNGTEIESVNAARGDDSWGPTSRFYCTTEQSFYAKVRWLTLGGCLYFLPELFAIPPFQPVLEQLFQARIPLTHLLRFAMLPVDPIWAKVRRVDAIYLKHADRSVGVHVRYRGGYENFQKSHNTVNNNIKQCLVENLILPNTTSNSSDGILTTTSSSPPRSVLLFISSLYRSLYDDLSKTYPQMPTTTGEVVGLVQLSSEGDQYSGLEVDSRALVEILCLSFSDMLLKSPMSTYSELAHAYGGLSPWIINTGSRDRGRLLSPEPACWRGKALDGCYHGAGVFYVCPYDPDVDKRQIMKLVPSLEPCEDGTAGVQLRDERS